MRDRFRVGSLVAAGSLGILLLATTAAQAAKTAKDITRYFPVRMCPINGGQDDDRPVSDTEFFVNGTGSPDDKLSLLLIVRVSSRAPATIEPIEIGRLAILDGTFWLDAGQGKECVCTEPEPGSCDPLPDNPYGCGFPLDELACYTPPGPRVIRQLKPGNQLPLSDRSRVLFYDDFTSAGDGWALEGKASINNGSLVLTQRGDAASILINDIESGYYVLDGEWLANPSAAGQVLVEFDILTPPSDSAATECDSNATDIAGLRREAAATPTSARIHAQLDAELFAASNYLAAGLPIPARIRLGDFAGRVGNQSHAPRGAPDRIEPADANRLICGALRVLRGINPDGARH